MLRQLLDRNPTIQHLVNEGYHVDVAGSYLVIRDIPYVNTDGQVARAELVDELTSDTNSKPRSHTIWFTGSDPCDASGAVLKLLSRPSPKNLGEGLKATHQFSQKPPGTGKYPDHYSKVTAYVRLLEDHAQRIDPTATAQTYPALVDTDAESPFNYLDTASSRAGIVKATEKLRLSRVAVVGLGGTGGYILDQLAKLPISEIHLYDSDVFSPHNAFRAPGAATRADLDARPLKVDHFKSMYEPMRSGIVTHQVSVRAEDAEVLAELASMGFVFMAFDGGTDKQVLAQHLANSRVPFIDVGMGLLEREGTLSGQLRIAAVTEDNQERATDHDYLGLDEPEDNDYDNNVQVADMNALNAVLAVIRFKKLLGFYSHTADSLSCLYTVFDNYINNESST